VCSEVKQPGANDHMPNTSDASQDALSDKPRTPFIAEKQQKQTQVKKQKLGYIIVRCKA